MIPCETELACVGRQAEASEEALKRVPSSLLRLDCVVNDDEHERMAHQE
jgi:hypothetical protein